jgi:hypothetical protein
MKTGRQDVACRKLTLIPCGKNGKDMDGILLIFKSCGLSLISRSGLYESFSIFMKTAQKKTV